MIRVRSFFLTVFDIWKVIVCLARLTNLITQILFKTQTHTMKKVYLTLALGALALGANAQSSRISEAITAKSPFQPFAKSVNTPTTIAITTQTSASLTINTIGSSTNCPGGGYVEGKNCIGDKQKANFFAPSTFTAVTGSSITAVGFAFFKDGNEGVSGSANTVTVSIYNGTMASGPAGAAIATATVTLAQILAAHTNTANTVFLASIPLTSAIATPAAGFFASISIPAAVGDTIVVANQLNPTSNFGWQQAANNSWVNMNTFWTAAFGGSTYNANLSIYPVLNGEQFIDTKVSELGKDGLSLSPAFPNPAKDEVNISFSLAQAGNVEIALFDVTGKQVENVKLENLQTGSHSTKIDVSSLNAGIYMYSIKANNAQAFSKLTVIK